MTKTMNVIRNALLIGAILASPATRAADVSQDAQYWSQIITRASAAKESKDVVALVECAYSLYPRDLSLPPNERQAAGLLNTATDLTLALNDPQQARMLLELTAALASAMDPAKRDKLVELAAGSDVADLAEKKAEEASPKLKQHAQDLGDPDVAARGPFEKNLAELLGGAVLGFLRPSVVAAKRKPYVDSYRFERNGSVLTLRVDLVYYDAFTDNRYDGQATIKVWVGADSVQILSVLYRDSNIIPIENMKYVDQFIEVINKKLS